MDLQKLCRICMSKTDLLVSIYNPTFLLQPIRMIEQLNIFKVDDCLSEFLCQSCLYHIMHILNEITQLQQVAQASEIQMQEYLARCNTNLKQDAQIVEFQHSFASLPIESSNFCDIFQTPTVTDTGADDMINEVEIDVSSLTRSDADDSLSEVFVDVQMSCPYQNNENIFNAEIGNSSRNETELNSSPEPTPPYLGEGKQKLLKQPETCHQCKKTFKTTGYSEIHKRKHTGEKPFTCKLCSRCFSYRGNLRLHQQTHSKQRRFQCEICAKFFTTSSNLKSHLLIHRDEREFQCEKCLKCFKTKRDLRRHETVHDVTKAHQCTICEKEFVKRSYLSAHILTVHRNERKHKCQDCDKVFATISNLKCHMRIHSGAKPFQCEHCQWKFSQSSALTRHILKKHKNNGVDRIENKAIELELQLPTTTTAPKAPESNFNQEELVTYSTTDSVQNYVNNKYYATSK